MFVDIKEEDLRDSFSVTEMISKMKEGYVQRGGSCRPDDLGANLLIDLLTECLIKDKEGKTHCNHNALYESEDTHGS